MAHQPQNLVVTPVSTTEIELSWDDVGTLEDETFDIERNSVIVEASWAGGTTYTDTGLDPNTEYTYRVRAVGGIIPAPVTPPAAPVAARVSIFTPVITVSANASVTPSTVSAVVVAFASDIAATTSTVTPSTVVGTVAVEFPTIQGESYSDSYGLSYGGTGGISADVTLSTVVTASTVLTPVIFSSTDIAGLVAWYNFSDIGTLWQDTARTSAITTDAQVIKGVTDLSGNGKHLSEATNGPTYKEAIQNGHSLARFDGSNDKLTASITMAQPITVFAVVKPTTAGADDTLFDTSPGNAGRFYRSNADDKLGLYAGAVLVSGSALFPVGSFYVASGVLNGASSQVRLNGVGGTGNAGSTAPGATTYLGVFGNGSSAPWHGDIAEVIIYDSALSTANHNLVGNYLASKWGLTWTTI